MLKKMLHEVYQILFFVFSQFTLDCAKFRLYIYTPTQHRNLHFFVSLKSEQILWNLWESN